MVMIKRVGNKHGDTLIEVMFAVGIFSLVAIAVVSVMNGSLRNVQMALETTMTRNEIDAQAEAIRFIQAGYMTEKDVSDDKKVYTAAWNEIIGLANLNDTEEKIISLSKFEPKTCDELYNEQNGEKTVISQNAFIINTRKLGDKDGVVVVAKDNSDIFGQSNLYPRMLFGEEDSSLAKATLSKNLLKAEGIYVVGAPDMEKNTYYDFYIRTCWNGAGQSQVSTISTVIRLYNPDYSSITK